LQHDAARNEFRFWPEKTCKKQAFFKYSLRAFEFSLRGVGVWVVQRNE